MSKPHSRFGFVNESFAREPPSDCFLPISFFSVNILQHLFPGMHEVYSYWTVQDISGLVMQNIYIFPYLPPLPP